MVIFFPQMYNKNFSKHILGKVRKGSRETKDGRDQGFFLSSTINFFALLFLSFPLNGLVRYNPLTELNESRAAFKVQLLMLPGKRKQGAIVDQIKCRWEKS